MAAAVSEFGRWLNDKLKSLNTDESVFGSYISGILDGDDTIEEKKEALEGILSEFIQNDISSHVGEILNKWSSLKPMNNVPATLNADNVDEKLAKLLESQSLATAPPRQYTEEEKKIREAILSQYSQMPDNEESENISGEEGPSGGDLVKNTNASDVAAAAKERREQARMDSQKKKDKDKEDREKQKQLREDKKEKRKTQKGERRR